MLNKIYSRGIIVCAHDILMAAASFFLSVYLRLGFSGFEVDPRAWAFAALVFTIICACVFWPSGLYRGVWRYASLNDLWAITKAVTTATLIFSFVMFIWVRLEPLPRSVLLINWFVLMALLGGPRFFYRFLKDRRFSISNYESNIGRVPVILVGAGDGAELFIRSLRRTTSSGYEVVGIVAEDARRVGREIHGVQILGTTDQIDIIAGTLRSKGKAPQRLILTNDDMEGYQVRTLLNAANSLGMTIARLPKVTDFRSGESDPIETTPINVADLLGRPQVPLDAGSMERLIQGRCVMVTGAGGSIGCELVRQICNFAPGKLVLTDNSEFALYSVDLQVSEVSPNILRCAEYLDVRYSDRVDRSILRHQPDLVFHAAALKHVPIVEDNILDGVDTNVLGTANVAEACRRQGVGVMVLISTDKAVNPTSVMGATKRIAESYCQALDMSATTEKTRYVTVRFGNVLGSTGSVVPLFQRQLANGGPLTVTHKEMTRYFMTVREAVELVLQSSALAAGMTDGDGEVPKGNICVLDMGEPVRIYDLAEQMIRLAGLVPGKNVKIDVVGARPGEKLYEEIFHGGEPLVPTNCEGILLAAPRTADINDLRDAINTLSGQCAAFEKNDVIQTIYELVPEFSNEGSDIR
ncbi:MAG: nucleotide sugar dehydratase [Euryarchaeota archaeon]|nr:nucleotide sugar dehydratase [Euryarchaeota archaeon]